jgi:hypothetical protein
MRTVHVVLISMFFSSSVEAQEFFNGTDIDYWKEGLKPMAKPLYTSEKDLEASLSPTPNPSPVPTLLPTLLPSGSLIRQRDSLPFCPYTPAGVQNGHLIRKELFLL